ncbi:hypothetical protein LTR17_004954 [Elasticomyces elasticus]|nr:hypothetical protein LTR17_004954 [Elasticomyces elasticus]
MLIAPEYLHQIYEIKRQFERQFDQFSSNWTGYKVIELKSSDVVGILASREDSDGELEYEVDWKATGGAAHETSGVKHTAIARGPLLKQFIRTGQPARDESEDETLEISIEHLDSLDVEAGNPYWRFYQMGFWALLEQVHTEAIATSHSVVTEWTREDFHLEMVKVLSALPTTLLRGIMGAGVNCRRIADPGIRALLEDNLVTSKGRLWIYLLEFVDEFGLTVDAGSMRRIIKIIRRYTSTNPSIEEINEAVQIDSVAKDLSPAEKDNVRNGHRGYLSTTTRKSLATFIVAIEPLIAGLADDKRLPFVLRDVGYTDQGFRRIFGQHLKHSSSNKVMNLIEAIGLYDRELDNRYWMQGDVIFLAYRYLQSALGEVLFSILGQSYVETGRGFNGVKAGSSTASANKWKITSWQEWQQDTLDNTPITANLRLEADRVKAVKERKEFLEKEIARQKRINLENEVEWIRRKMAIQEEILHFRDLLLE